jgi:hypothetical protein
MAVDTSIKVRIFNNDQTEFKEITVSEQDNSLGSLFFCNEISYTSIKFDRQQEFSNEENKLLNLIESEEEEMMAYSEIYSAKEILPIIDKIYKKLYRQKSEALNNDLNHILNLEISHDEKTKRKKNKIGDYFDFESSFSIFKGIIKVASEQDNKIQIINEFY